MEHNREVPVPVRIAHFIQRYPPALGGSEAYFARLGKYLAAAGDEVVVFTSNALALEAFWSPRGRCAPAGRNMEEGVEVRRYKLLRWPARRYFLKVLSFLPLPYWQCLTMPCNPLAPGMWRDAGRSCEPFDAVHASAFPYAWPMACGLRLARRLKIPFYLTPFLHLGDPDHGRDPVRRAYTRRPLRYLLRAADLVFAQTESEKAAIERLGVPPQRVVLQGLGVDEEECTGGDRERSRRAWNIQPGEVVVGHLANNSREKGTVDLLRAAEHLWRQQVPVRIVLAGPEMPNFKAFWQSFASLPRANAVVRLGILDDMQKRDFFAGLDVFALPSRSDSFGLVLLEAWANGLPNVVYRAGGPADLVRHERDGLQVPCGDVSALAQALARLVADEALARRLGQTGRERLPREFRWADKLAMVRAAYQQPRRSLVCNSAC
jgi:glycosyltransferase involved in cell wall biosynthesis